MRQRVRRRCARRPDGAELRMGHAAHRRIPCQADPPLATEGKLGDTLSKDKGWLFAMLRRRQ
eukprot:347384-Chlamydomonas_euryale.AAC.2